MCIDDGWIYEGGEYWIVFCGGFGFEFYCVLDGIDIFDVDWF